MPLPTVPKDLNNVPIAEAYVPASLLFAAMRGTTATASDTNYTYAAACFGRFTSNVYARASAAATANGNSGDLTVDSFSELSFDANISVVSGTSPTLQFFIDRKGNDGIYYQIYSSASITATGTVSTSVGAGCTISQSFGTTVRLRWTIGGTTPSFTFSASVIGK